MNISPNKKWVLNSKTSSPSEEPNLNLDFIEKILLANRGLTSQEEIDTFFASDTTLSNSGVLEDADLSAAAAQVKKAVDDGIPIIIHGDYDVDGLSSTAILWETIYRGLGYQKCLPFIPNRFDHGYGLSKESVDASGNLASDKFSIRNFQSSIPNKLLITVDCGITALDEVNYAKEQGWQVLIIDHHQPSATRPDCNILWTDKLCAAGISYFVSQALLPGFQGLDLATMATIADIQPLLGLNRQIVKLGLPLLSKSNRFGVKALKEVAGLLEKNVGVYEVGWLLSPRLNASGRLEDALDSLRLLCSLDESLAKELAKKLSQVNSDRQRKTLEMVDHAEALLLSGPDNKIIIAAHESYHEGIIGLVAGKLAQKYHRPAVVISCGPEFCKGSARSINGFNIVEALRSQTDFLENVGGHPAAAGFTLKTEKLADFMAALESYGESNLTTEQLAPVLKIDAKIPYEILDWDLFKLVSKFEPFGLGNPEPTFLTKRLEVRSVKTMGQKSDHLSIVLCRGDACVTQGQACLTPTTKNNKIIRAVGFGFGEWSQKLKVGDKVDLVYTLAKNEWNGNVNLELRIKDLRLSIDKE